MATFQVQLDPVDQALFTPDVQAFLSSQFAKGVSSVKKLSPDIDAKLKTAEEQQANATFKRKAEGSGLATAKLDIKSPRSGTRPKPSARSTNPSTSTFVFTSILALPVVPWRAKRRSTVSLANYCFIDAVFFITILGIECEHDGIEFIFCKKHRRIIGEEDSAAEK